MYQPFSIKAAMAAFLTLLWVCAASAEALPRSTLLGVIPQSAQAGSDVIIQDRAPNSTASSLGLLAGDKLIAVNGTALTDFNSLLAVLRPLNAGDAITIKIERDGKTQQLSGSMQPRPYETSEHAAVVYDQVSYTGNQLRSIMHIPNGISAQQKAPAIFFIQGYTCSSIDYGLAPTVTTLQMLNQFSAAGYITYRVEKADVGDSISDVPCHQTDFTAEAQGFVEALKVLKQHPAVDTQQVYLWGHSLGVLHAPVVANQESVAGIIGYGGVAKSWYDYMLDIYQEQSVKHFNVSPATARSNVQRVKPFLERWLNSQDEWTSVLNAPGVQSALEADLVPINGELVFDRHYRFFRDLNGYDFTALWQQLEVPVLMLHGSLDIQAISSDWAFDLAALSQHPQSTAQVISGAEHAFMRFNDAATMRRIQNSGAYNPGQPGDAFDERIGEQTLTWLKTLQRAK